MSRILLKRAHKVLALASSVLLATSLAYGDQFDNLIAGHYAGAIQLRQVGGPILVLASLHRRALRPGC